MCLALGHMSMLVGSDFIQQILKKDRYSVSLQTDATRLHLAYKFSITKVFFYYHKSLCLRKPTICMGENKDADQLRGNREADQRLCFRYTDSTFPPLLIPKFSRSWVSSVTVQASLCQTWSKSQIVVFLMHRLINL